MKVMIEELWWKVLAGTVIAGISGFVSAALGVRVAQARMESRIDEIDKKITDKIDHIEKMMANNALHMGREIGELKEDLRHIKIDIYKPRFMD